MSKNTNLSFLTDYITADITNGRIGINNASPTVAFDVVGATKITGVLTLTSTISNGTYAYTLPSATGTLALTSALSGYLPLTGGTLTGALSGTSATFNHNDAPTIRIQRNGGTDSNTVIEFTNASRSFFIGSNGTSMGLGGTTGAISSQPLQITSTGAATFSSSVTATSASFTNSGALVGTFNRTTSSGATLAIQVVGSTVGTLGSSTDGNGAFDISSVSNAVASNNVQISRSGGTPTAFFSSAGNVGIGTTSPSSSINSSVSKVLSISNTSQYASLVIQGRNGGEAGITIADDLYIDIAGNSTGTNNNILFRTTNTNSSYGVTERMRITSGGVLFVGCTTQPGAGDATTGTCLGNAGYIIGQRNAATVGFFGRGTDNGELFAFFRGTTQVGNISVTTSATAYNTGSDYRLKEDLKEIKGIEKVSAIKVYDFKWKNEELRMDGVIAHELQEVLPYAVYGEKDGKEMQGVDYSKIVPVLVKAIQELSAKVSLLENK